MVDSKREAIASDIRNFESETSKSHEEKQFSLASAETGVPHSGGSQEHICIPKLRELHHELSAFIQAKEMGRFHPSGQLTARQVLIINQAKKMKEIIHDILSLCSKSSFPSTPSPVYSVESIENRIKELLKLQLDQLKDVIEVINQYEYKRSRLGEMRVDELKDVFGEVFLR